MVGFLGMLQPTTLYMRFRINEKKFEGDCFPY